MPLKLGKLAPQYDPRTLPLEKYLTAAAPREAPASCDWYSQQTHAWGMLANDRYGDCAPVACLHAQMSWDAYADRDADGKQLLYTDSDAVQAYADVTGFSPRDPSTDRGTIYIECMKHWQTKGIGGRRIAAFVSVNPRDQRLVKLGCWLMGGLQLGLQLPLGAQPQFASGAPWQAPASPKPPTGRWAAGTWGGHAVNVVGYDDSWVYCVTWGKIQRLSWHFWDTYADEAYAVISEEWFTKEGKSPSGFDLYTLWQDLRDVTDGRLPIPEPPSPAPILPPAGNVISFTVAGSSAPVRIEVPGTIEGLQATGWKCGRE